MRLSSRLIVSLILGISLVSAMFTFYQVRTEKLSRRNELNKRAEVVGDSLVEAIEPLMISGSHRELQRIVSRFGNREQLAGIAVYDMQGLPVAITPGLAQKMPTEPDAVKNAIANSHAQAEYRHMDEAPVHIYAVPLSHNGSAIGGLVIVHDASYINSQMQSLWRTTFLHILVQMFLIVLITLLIVRWSIAGPIASLAQWMRALRTGRGLPRSSLPDFDVFRPLAREASSFADSLRAARASAETEAKLRVAAESSWTAERLAVHVRSKLKGNRLFVISNREPYIHQHKGDALEVVVPASGLVTALEPVLCACEGTWIAHGSGNADHETVDQHHRLRVPPEEPKYTLRRVWLTKEEEEGYYYGFANEGLWPLCHIAHTRPIFRPSDWNDYEQVNRKFSEALLQEIDCTEQPVILVQDYHFALLPRIIKRERPDARVAIFWHIPWPNPEAFSICPWQDELLDGLLGADLIGFHIQAHCNNFLETVDRALESRIAWEQFAVRRENHFTLVRPYPISVVFQEADSSPETMNQAQPGKAPLFKELGIESHWLGLGVDRVDYTKGIIERFLAVERFMEKYPTYVGRFSFIQIGAPSRTHIKRYHDLLAEVEAEAERINWRFQTRTWKPLIFLKRQHSHQEIQRYYQAADLCMVTSLHDGMNLVAKEFVAARADERGALILSKFTGACRELQDAILVNPYDIDQMTEAIRAALEMSPEDQTARMRLMRKSLKEQNIYRWAGNLTADLCEIRVESMALEAHQRTQDYAASA
jgi:trehalose-6-phosphate synthase